MVVNWYSHMLWAHLPMLLYSPAECLKFLHPLPNHLQAFSFIAAVCLLVQQLWRTTMFCAMNKPQRLTINL